MEGSGSSGGIPCGGSAEPRRYAARNALIRRYRIGSDTPRLARRAALASARAYGGSGGAAVIDGGLIRGGSGAVSLTNGVRRVIGVLAIALLCSSCSGQPPPG